jgi:hypothetical protein
MEFATKAFQYSQQAHEKSVNFLNAAKNSPATKPSAKTSGKGKK